MEKAKIDWCEYIPQGKPVKTKEGTAGERIGSGGKISMNKTKIETFDSSWNPVTGCLHGCEYCYARDIAKRFSGYDSTGNEPNVWESTAVELTEPMTITRKNLKQCKAPYPFGFKPTFHRYKLDEYKDKSGRNIFVCSMADLFGDWVPDEWIREVFEACWKAPQHNYLFLTKNPERYAESGVPGDKNFWFWTSVCRKEDIEKCKHLPLGANRFISIEPILEDLEIVGSPVISYVDWFIIGAETGRRKDKIVPERKWIDDIVNECQRNETPVFMKSSLAPIWGEPLIQEFPDGLKK